MGVLRWSLGQVQNIGRGLHNLIYPVSASPLLKAITQVENRERRFILWMATGINILIGSSVYLYFSPNDMAFLLAVLISLGINVGFRYLYLHSAEASAQQIRRYQTIPSPLKRRRGEPRPGECGPNSPPADKCA